MRLREFALAGTMSAVIFSSGLGAFALYAPEDAQRHGFGGGVFGSRAQANVVDNDGQLNSFIQVVALSHWEGMTTTPPSQGVNPAPLLLAAYTPAVAHAEESSIVVERGD
ncbi:MAG: hypothetical protein O7C63_01740, partial [Alphaproteobacteria bacterium]|nr:hypothetical protein [Alphaproteobacteria bacterium]